ncbi:hypothetical protein GCM10009744_41630 [Kribbella alba]|uniref:Transposase for insertion sequence element IS21-like C-terminal domain-containing protein n=1 Tax=Kribbella alba TaxID=190197 RepID=A0ABP4RF00_9ACTN
MGRPQHRGRDYYVRLDTNDYSVDPTLIGRMVDVAADLERVRVRAEALEDCVGVSQPLGQGSRLASVGTQVGLSGCRAAGLSGCRGRITV